MKNVFLLLLFTSLAYAKFQTVSIGNIDTHYKESLSHKELLSIIKEIEYIFESQLGFNVFDYAKDGKPIDILYLAPSKKKKKILTNLKKIESLKHRLDALHEANAKTKKIIQTKRDSLNKAYEVHNKAVKDFNSYIASLNKTVTQEEYEVIQREIAKRKKMFKAKESSLKKQKKLFNKKLASSKRDVRKYNQLVKRYNRFNRDTEKLSRTFKEIKGVTKSTIKTTSLDNIEQTKDVTMQKIEIYSFESRQQLKVVLAHELAHLVGVGHRDVKGALMNPLVQKKQLEKLELTYEDIEAFYMAFNSP